MWLLAACLQTSVIHYGTYELLIQRQSVPDGETAAPIQKRTEYPESLGCSSSNLVYVSSPGKSLIKGDPEIFDMLILFSALTSLLLSL